VNSINPINAVFTITVPITTILTNINSPYKMHHSVIDAWLSDIPDTATHQG
jgi:hypothetical protein